MRAAPLNQTGNPTSPEVSQRRVDGNCTPAAGGLRDELRWLALPTAGQVRRADRHRPRERVRNRDNRQGAVIRNVEPLVRIDRPRMGPLPARYQTLEPR